MKTNDPAKTAGRPHKRRTLALLAALVLVAACIAAFALSGREQAAPPSDGEQEDASPVTVYFLENELVMRTVTCDAQASALIRETLLDRPREEELAPFAGDLELLIDGATWVINTETRQAMSLDEAPLGAVLTNAQMLALLDAVN